MGLPVALAALTALVIVVSVWVVSLIVRDASIIDIAWGPSFGVIAVVAALAADPVDRVWLVPILTVIWGARLGLYLGWRNIGKGEDPRYRAMRERHGARFSSLSLRTVFLTQGALMVVVGLPVTLAHGTARAGALIPVGIALWAAGLAFETVGDLQLARFKADPSSRGQVMDRGLWRYTRHPNYFGDFLVWWGLFFAAVGYGAPVWTIVGPVVMTTLLTRVSGAALLERGMAERRPGYADYIRRTSGFIPWPPRKVG